MRIIGDVHGKIAAYDKELHRKYLDIIQDAPYSIQVGDMGLDLKKLVNCGVDAERHKFVGGNHDNYDQYYDIPHNLGDYGPRNFGGLDFFVVRGAFSIDWRGRFKYIEKTGIPIWWEKEQLNRQEMEHCLELYTQIKPRIVITHTCPDTISIKIGRPSVLKHFGYDPERFTTHTQQLLEAMINVHQPDYWFFGHFHNQLKIYYKDTVFYGCGVLSWYDLEINSNGKILNIVDSES